MTATRQHRGRADSAMVYRPVDDSCNVRQWTPQLLLQPAPAFDDDRKTRLSLSLADVLQQTLMYRVRRKMSHQAKRRHFDNEQIDLNDLFTQRFLAREFVIFLSPDFNKIIS